MESISRYLGGDHKRCDELFAQAETCVDAARWEEAATALHAFGDALEQHFAMEENVLFPAFEKAVGSTEGPTRVMRMEHQQMRGILAQVRTCLEQRDADAFFGYSDTLNTMVQQHNMKEESILYPMSERVLSDRHEEIVVAMRAMEASA